MLMERLLSFLTGHVGGQLFNGHRLPLQDVADVPQGVFAGRGTAGLSGGGRHDLHPTGVLVGGG